MGLDATVTDPPFNTQMKALEGQVRIAVQNELALVLTLIPDPDKKELDVYRAATLVLDRVSFSRLFYSNHQPSNRKPQEYNDFFYFALRFERRKTSGLSL